MENIANMEQRRGGANIASKAEGGTITCNDEPETAQKSRFA